MEKIVTPPKLGTFYGVGVGPGDPELLTLKAHRILQEVDVVAYPACKEGADSYASRIVNNLLPAKTPRMGLVFPMVKDTEPIKPIWRESMEKMVAELRQGKNVAFVTEGDPFFYSTFLHMYEMFQAEHPEITIEVVPGVSSVTAAAIAGRVPLAVSDERMAVLPATYAPEKLLQALREYDVVVLMKISGVLTQAIDAIEQAGLLSNAIFVERVGSKEERIVRDITSLRGKKVNYLSLIIVKKDGTT